MLYMYWYMFDVFKYFFFMLMVYLFVYLLVMMEMSVLKIFFFGIMKLLVENSGVSGSLSVLFFYLYMFVFFTCFMGFMPYSYLMFTNFYFTQFVAFLVWLSCFYYFINCLVYSICLVNKGQVKLLSMLLVPVEFLSDMSRPISLMIRLFINVMVGHFLCELVLKSSVWFSFTFIHFMLITFVILMETFVFIIQSYIFSYLSYIYLGENSGHL